MRRVETMPLAGVELAAWLPSPQGTQGAIESPGVSWKPVWNLLAGQFVGVLVKAPHLMAGPGRKTDIKACQGLPDLWQHGGLRGHFVPPPSSRRLRALTR